MHRFVARHDAPLIGERAASTGAATPESGEARAGGYVHWA